MKFVLLLAAVSIASMVSGQTTLPYEQTFDAVTIPAGWTQVDNAGTGQLWQFGTDGSTGQDWGLHPALTDNYAILNGGAVPAAQKNVDLISPTFNFSGVDIVILQFFHFLYQYENYDAVGTISYSTDDGGTWTTIKQWDATTSNPETFNESIGAVANQATVKFKWNFTGKLLGWAIDNISLSENNVVVWAGTNGTDWNNPANWNPAVVPGTNSYVWIPDGAINYPILDAADNVSCHKLFMDANAELTINAGATLTVYEEFAPAGLTIKSDGTGTGSVIARSVAGILPSTIERYVDGHNKWYLVASPVVQDVADFLTNNPGIPTKNPGDRGMMDFNTTTDSWNASFTNSTTESFEAGKGYLMRIETGNGFTFEGAITGGEVTVPLSRGGYRWNLVGNPYTSAIKLNAVVGMDNFLNINKDVLDESFVAVYRWDDAIEQYYPTNLTDGVDYGTIGQGFFVKANTGTGNLTFIPEMQFHVPSAVLKSGSIIPEIKLEISSSEKTASTQIKFIEQMTTGLDIGYDAGILKADPGFSVFTRLVKDNNIEFALQCLPIPSKETMIIPVGVDFRNGGEITFNAKMLNLPEGSSVVFEDRLLEKFTAFDNTNSEYKAIVAANAESTGRFFVHVSGKSQVTATDSGANLKNVNAWMERNEIVISGTTGDNAVVRLFDIQGRSVFTRNLERTSVNRINVSGINPGIYMLQVIENGKHTGIKLNISGN